MSKRVIFDTNIYGIIIENQEIDLVMKKLDTLNFIVYGSETIRKELSETSKKKIILAENKKRKIRILLLNAYDLIIKNHQLPITNESRELAGNYYRAYKPLGGLKDYSEIINDFTIVSIATLNRLDIVYSEDNKTMCGNDAIKSYELVNSIKKLKTPFFKSYEEFKNEISKK